MMTFTGGVSKVQLRSFYQEMLPARASVITAIAGILTLGASIVPWLNDPLGNVYVAWQLPVNIGWQVHTVLINYGLLCFCCAVYTFFVVYAQWKPFKGSNYFAGQYRTAAVLCLVPVILFIFQYLFADVTSIELLTQHKIQELLIQHHFGYNIAPVLIPINPLLVDPATLNGRAVLLLDQVAIGPLLLLLSTCILLYGRRFAVVVYPTKATKQRGLLWIGAILLLIILLGRAPAAMASEDEAKMALAMGNYPAALHWLNTAVTLNPALNQVPYYHIDHGQALYYLLNDQQNDDSRAYLAYSYREQGDYLDAYQQVLALWQSNRTTPWVVDEMSATLERLAEYIQPLRGRPERRSATNSTALSWAQLLSQVDTSDVYGQYLLGSIEYDLHNYADSIVHMKLVLQLSAREDIRSSAYTYMALSEAGEGNYAEERLLLLKAIALDPAFHNNTAREELSGLR